MLDEINGSTRKEKETMAHIDEVKRPKAKRNQVTVQFPFTYHADDYHEFAEAQDRLADALGIDVRIDEVGFDDATGTYVGVAYLGRNGIPQRFVKALREAIDRDNDEMWG